MNRYCIVCGNAIPATKRSDAQTCSDRCRIEKSKRSITASVQKQELTKSQPIAITPLVLHDQSLPEARLTDQQQQLLQEIDQLKSVLNRREQQLYEAWQQLETVLKPQADQLDVELRQKREMLRQKQLLLKMNDLEFYNNYGLFLDRSSDNVTYISNTMISELRRSNFKYIETLQEYIYQLEIKQVALKSEVNQVDSFVENIKQLRRDDKKRLMLLESTFYGTSIPKTSSKPIEKKMKALPSPPKARIVSGNELIYSSLEEPISLPGHLGAFLGRVERHRFFLALTGDAGSGKSELSFRLAKTFTLASMQVMYFSLEMGINHDVQSRVKRYSLNERFYIREEGNLADVRKEADRYDVIILDSYGKLDVEAEEIDQLRNHFPKTFFIFIFQKTTTGTIRGGSKVIFDCTASIDLSKDEQGRRVASMVKSRYGTQGYKYYLVEDKMISQ